MEETWLHWLTASMDWIQASGWVGMLWFVVLYTLTCVFFLPGSALTVGAGAVYGFWGGTVLVTVSSTVGAVVNFLTARYLMRAFVLRHLSHSPKFLSLDRAIGKEGAQVVLVSRVSPVVPHSLVSYIAGVTKISFWKFSLASFIGFIPISVAYSYAGALLGAVARTKLQITTNDPLTWFFYGVGLIVTVGAVVMTARMAARALRQSMPDAAGADALTLQKNPGLPCDGQETLPTTQGAGRDAPPESTTAETGLHR
jgi:uncharacterized membrane protein YdjX (TVP38/TMEM64 family)